MHKYQTVFLLCAFFTFYKVVSEDSLSSFQLFEAGFFFNVEGRYILCEEFLKS